LAFIGFASVACMHQVFPSSASTERTPKSVQRAVNLMCAGAVILLWQRSSSSYFRATSAGA
jgi:hypothetical protein